MKAAITQLIRVAVAGVVGYLVALLAKQGIHLPDVWEQAAVTAITAGVATLFYNGVTWLEKRWPWMGHLLLVKPAPSAAR